MPLRTSNTLYSIGPINTGASIASADVDTNIVPADVSGQTGWGTVDDALEGLDAQDQSLLAQDAAFMTSLSTMQASLTSVEGTLTDLGDVANENPIATYDGA